MAEEKNILEEAIIQMKNLEEAVAENAKGILGSVMRQEIKDLVKESLNEQEDEEEVDSEDESDVADVEFEDEDEMDDEDMEDEMDDEDMEDEMDDEDMEDEMDNEDMEDEMDNEDMEDEMDDEDMEDEMDDEDMEDDEEVTIDLTNEPIQNVMKVFSRMKDTDKITVVKDEAGNIELSDDETNKEYYIVSEGMEMDDELYEMDEPIYELEIENPEMMEMDDMEMMEMDDMEMMEMDDMEMMEMDDETLYELEMNMDEEDDMEGLSESKKSMKPKGLGIGNGPKFNYGKIMDYPTKKTKQADEAPYIGKGPKYSFDKNSPSLKGEFKGGKYGMNKGDKSKTHKGDEDYTTKKGMKSKTHKGLDFEKKETKEASRTYGSGSKSGRGLRKGITPNRNLTFESVESQQVSLLREKNEEYRKALNVFRNKLNEVAIFNSNLAYATRLFTEHSTSKQEKINILQRFDGVETLKESKNLYRIIKDELTTSKSQQVNESIERKIQKTPSNGSSINLIESKTYENPQFLRMKDLMSKLK